MGFKLNGTQRVIVAKSPKLAKQNKHRAQGKESQQEFKHRERKIKTKLEDKATGEEV